MGSPDAESRTKPLMVVFVFPYIKLVKRKIYI
jgi:hypothetical protein